MKIQSYLLTPMLMEGREKFWSPQNICGALQQNRDAELN